MASVEAEQAFARHERVCVLAPLGRDAALICQILAFNDIEAAACTGMHELASQVQEAGAAVLTEEALTRVSATELVDALRLQPSWSDVPLIALVSRNFRSKRTSEALNALLSATNLVVLERPLLGMSLTSAVQAALRMRRRQFQQRDLMRSEQEARRHAQAALRSRDDFLATLSHELRTPLNAIVLWTKLMDSEKRDPNILMQGLPAIVRSADALSTLIEELLDMARMVAGTLQIDLRPVVLDDELRAAVDVVRPLAERKAIELEASFGTEVVVHADPHRLQQSIWNLLTNAIKFTPRGGHVTIRSSCQHSRARIEVGDTGKGIDAKFLPHVFEHFRQAEAATNRLEGGLGLGLAITRQLVHLHGGTIRVESAGTGTGALFTIELPLEQPTSSDDRDMAARASDCDLNDIRVLLVDDDRSTREALSAVLQTYGARVFPTDTAQSALEQLRTSIETGLAPHVLVIDLGLPATDGFGLLQRIRSAEQARNTPRLPAALITGYVNSESRERALAAGFQAYLPKPIEPKRLVEVVQELVRSSGSTMHG
jgi:signal transduction histidine kinase/ActR/RegA family two-component response regulator